MNFYKLSRTAPWALLLVSALIAGPLMAQDHFYVGPQATYQFWDSSRFLPGLDDDNGVQAGLNLGYMFSSSSAAVELSATTTASSSQAEADVYELNYYTYFAPDSHGIRSYMLTGISRVEMDNTRVMEPTSTNVVVGFGLSRYLSDYLELKTDMRLRSQIDRDYKGNVLDLGMNVALNYHFGKTAPKAAPVVVAPAPAPAPAPRAAPAPAPAPTPVVREQTTTLTVNFALNSSVVQTVNTNEFTAMAAALRADPSVTLTIEGHTDSTGTDEYNQVLSQRRADNVKQELISKYGVAAGRVNAVGYGEAKPMADNATAAGRAQNRRVVGLLRYRVTQ